MRPRSWLRPHLYSRQADPIVDALHDVAGKSWLLLPPEAVPKVWRSRSREMALIPLLPEEKDSVLSGVPASPQIDERDEQIMRMVMKGATLSEMSRTVGLSPRGVQHRLARLRERFGLRTTAELAAYLARLGMEGGANTQ